MVMGSVKFTVPDQFVDPVTGGFAGRVMNDDFDFHGRGSGDLTDLTDLTDGSDWWMLPTIMYSLSAAVPRQRLAVFSRFMSLGRRRTQWQVLGFHATMWDGVPGQPSNLIMSPS